MKNVLITGVAGFIGSNLADRLLNDGYRVRGIDNLAYGLREQVPDGVDFREVDIRATDLQRHFDGIDVVFHLAAKNSIGDCQRSPLETVDINVHGTVNVMEAVRLAGATKVVYAETSAVYEGCTALPSREDDIAPQSVYATSKMSGRLFAETYARFHDVALTSLRYFCVYGPRQDYRRTIPPVMSAFIMRLLEGDAPVIYGTGQKRRDFIYVDDVNDFHLRCITDPRTSGGIYNLGSGTNVSVFEIYQAISAELGIAIDPVYKPDQPAEAQENLGDITAARALGWEPRVDLREGLRRMIAYLEEHVMPARREALAKRP